MAGWHVLVGLGIGMLATVLTMVINQRRRIPNKSFWDEQVYIAPPDETCLVCLTPLSDDEMIYLPCGHAFHDECVKNLRRHNHKTCPVCRQTF